MSWLLEIIESFFGAIFDLACRAVLRDKTRPRWFNYSLAIGYFVFPTLIMVSVFISWKITMIVTGVFIFSLITGAMSEADDPRFY